MFTYSVAATKRLQASRGWGKSEFLGKKYEESCISGKWN